MPGDDGRTVAVLGATGLQGGAVARRLLRDGRAVRALTRDPRQRKARALAALGAEVVAVDATVPATLERALDGVHGVYCVQNHRFGGYAGEVAQATNVADAASRAGVRHLVYASAGPGSPGTGVGSWETKVEAVAHMRSLDLPLTVLRPMAFMDLMTERRFFPPATVWHLMPKLIGPSRPLPWLAVADLAVIAAKVFADPEGFVGRDVPLASDVRSLEECRALWQQVTGRRPRSLPMPVQVFERMAGTDETTMWRWLATHEIGLDTGPTLAIHAEALTVERFLATTVGRGGGAAAA